MTSIPSTPCCDTCYSDLACYQALDPHFSLNACLAARSKASVRSACSVACQQAAAVPFACLRQTSMFAFLCTCWSILLPPPFQVFASFCSPSNFWLTSLLTWISLHTYYSYLLPYFLAGLFAGCLAVSLQHVTDVQVLLAPKTAH